MTPGSVYQWFGQSDGESWAMEVESDCFNEDEGFVVSVWVGSKLIAEGAKDHEIHGAYLTSGQAREVAECLVRHADHVDSNNARGRS